MILEQIRKSPEKRNSKKPKIKGKSERIKEVKKRYADVAYLYKCENCDHIIMMHERACVLCLAENKYFEETVKPSDDITRKIRDEIESEDV